MFGSAEVTVEAARQSLLAHSEARRLRRHSFAWSLARLQGSHTSERDVESAFFFFILQPRSHEALKLQEESRT